jgi:hypothetical protein
MLGACAPTREKATKSRGESRVDEATPTARGTAVWPHQALERSSPFPHEGLDQRAGGKESIGLGLQHQTGHPSPWGPHPDRRRHLRRATPKAEGFWNDRFPTVVECARLTQRATRSGRRAARSTDEPGHGRCRERLVSHSLAREPTADSVRCAPAVGGGSPLAFGVMNAALRLSSTETEASVE